MPSTAPSTETAGVIAVQKAGAEQREQDRDRQLAAPRGLVGLLDQRGEREDPALALVVGAEHEYQVLEHHHQHQGPEEQRQHAEHLRRVVHPVRRRGDRVLLGGRRRQALAHRVERRGADVAVDHAERCERQPGELLSVRPAVRVLAHRALRAG
jgi:hypothetical protein